MNNCAATVVESIPPISFAEWLEICSVENHRFAEALGRVGRDQWTLPTDCEAWTVRDLVGHVLGSLHVNAATVRSGAAFVKATVRAKRRGTQPIDEATNAEVEMFADRPTSELLGLFEDLAPKNITGRRRTPKALRRLATQFEGQRLTIGDLNSRILTRDIWMHRIDLCRATSQTLQLTADHDGRIVADVVASWAQRHAQPFHLHLTGPAGNTFTSGEDGEDLELDAIEFCRILAGRGSGDGLLKTAVIF